jgi:type IV secretory pathway VirB4 component
LYPFNYSGLTDANGFLLGRDKFGSNIIVDFNKRTDDKTNANILILGNSGQGKSYLLKLILTNLRESGMNILALDGGSTRS